MGAERMTLTSIIGDVGTGKTLLATALALKDNRKIYSNYKINSDRYERLEPSMLVEINEPSLIIMDEAYMWLEARTSSKNLNRYISYLLFQSRKSKQEYIITAQLFGTVDLRFREMSDYIILADRSEGNIIDGDFVYKVFKQSNIHSCIRSFSISYEKAVDIFKYYDTAEKIPIPYDLIGDSILDKRDMLPEVDEIIIQLLKVRKAKDWTRAQITDHCLRHSLPKVYIEPIYNGIKARC